MGEKKRTSLFLFLLRPRLHKQFKTSWRNFLPGLGLINFLAAFCQKLEARSLKGLWLRPPHNM